jgi:hypothetical protein
MILEVLIDVILPAIGRLIGFILLDVLLYIFWYSSGFVLCRVFTLGRYPKKHIPWDNEVHQELLVNMVGFVFWVAVLLAVLRGF